MARAAADADAKSDACTLHDAALFQIVRQVEKASDEAVMREVEARR